MAARHGSELCTVLPALYHLTGADYASKVGTKRSTLCGSLVKFLGSFAKGKNKYSCLKHILPA